MGIPALLLAAAIAAGPTSLDEIVALARGGASQLALQLLDAYQDDDALARADWMAAERERVHILAAAGRWEVLSARLSELPSGVPVPFAVWAAERRVEALLHAGEDSEALSVLQSLVWDGVAPEDDALREWRMLIVRAYLGLGDRDAALTAMSRYAQDHGRDDPVLRALHGEVLLAAGRADEAVHVLGDLDDPLRWLAALRAAERSAGAVFERAVRLGSARDERPAVRRAAWQVAAEAAQRMGNRPAAVAAYERALRMDPGTEPVPPPLVTEPAALWDAYHEWGRALGNDARLIVGVDEEWLAAAAARADREAAQARALLAAVALDTRDSAVAGEAHARFARSLATEAGGDRVLAALYLDASPFEKVEAAPPAVRALLIDAALARDDLALAARLVHDLEPPEGADRVAWDLRRARVLVLAGERTSGAAVLAELFASEQAYDVDSALQVLFDMQAADAHVEALPLFGAVLARDDLEPQQRREVHYWMADSHSALQSHAAAARLYLHSAMAGDPYAMDRWAQTARYQAAEALARAGLRADAAEMLRGLLNATEEAGRRAMLQHRIDEITAR